MYVFGPMPSSWFTFMVPKKMSLFFVQGVDCKLIMVWLAVEKFSNGVFAGELMRALIFVV